MTTWFTADLHFGHANIISYSGRPFADATAMNEALIERWNASVHDRCWAGHGRRAEGWTERYLAAGFAEVHRGQTHVNVAARQVLACHFPYRGDSHDHDRFVEQRPVDQGEWLLHGHVHERWRQRGRMINVGVDAWRCGPVDESTLAALMDDGSNDLALLPSGESNVVLDSAS